MYNINGRSSNIGMILPMSNANINGTGYMLNQQVKYTLQSNLQIISTANSNRDGSGTMASLVTAASNGTLIKRITIKAQGNTTQGMIRLFYYDGTNTRLWKEVPVPAITQTSQDKTFDAMIEHPLYPESRQFFNVIIEEPFYLEASQVMKVSTENAETFIVTTDTLNMAYP